MIRCEYNESMTCSRRSLLKASVAVAGLGTGCLENVETGSGIAAGRRDPVARTVSLINSRSPLTENAPSLGDEKRFFGTILTERSDLERLRRTSTFDPTKYRRFDFENAFISLNAATLPYDHIMTGERSTVSDGTFQYRGRIEKQPDGSSEERIYNVFMVWNVPDGPTPSNYQMQVRGRNGTVVHTSEGTT